MRRTRDAQPWTLFNTAAQTKRKKEVKREKHGRKNEEEE
jgi:hypothetical protein